MVVFEELGVGDEPDLLEGLGPSDDSGDIEAIGNTILLASSSETAQLSEAGARTAEERIRSLFESMASSRKVLMGIIEFCTDRQTVAAVESKVDELQSNSLSIFTAANYCSHLQQAGAINRVTETGEDSASIKVEPIVVEEDGTEFLMPGSPPEVFWLTTEEGRRYLAADNPHERLMSLFSNEPAYLLIYKRILTLCLSDGGKTTKQLGAAVDDDAIVQKPRMYAQRFINRLEKCDALIWEKTWKTTDIGRLGVEELKSIQDSASSPEAAGEGATHDQD